MSGHTPGPWIIDHSARGCVVRPGKQTRKGQRISADLTLADARLVAAAPELLTVLRTLVEGFDGDTECTELLDIINTTARAAIAKATS